MQKDVRRELFRPENKKMRSGVFLVLFLGVVLMLTGKTFFGGEGEKEQESAPSAEKESGTDRETERRMAETLSMIAGAGKVEVMLTYAGMEEKRPAWEEKREESRTEDGGKVTESLKKESSVVLLEDERGKTKPFVVTEKAAKAEGIVIVAEGGNDPVVCEALHRAAQALVDVPAHKIVVLKMK